MRSSRSIGCCRTPALTAHILAGLKVVRYQIAGRTIVQRTKISPEAAEILKNLGISKPKKLLTVIEPPQANAAS